jgi:hypothetical protein
MNPIQAKGMNWEYVSLNTVTLTNLHKQPGATIYYQKDHQLITKLTVESIISPEKLGLTGFYTKGFRE